MSYRGSWISFNQYGRDEYTINHHGMLFWFTTVHEAKRFVKQLNKTTK